MNLKLINLQYIDICDLKNNMVRKDETNHLKEVPGLLVNLHFCLEGSVAAETSSITHIVNHCVLRSTVPGQ